MMTISLLTVIEIALTVALLAIVVSYLRDRWGRKPPVIRTTIDGMDYSVTEWCRKQAAVNMKADPAKRAEVEKMIGADEARRRYPEAFQ